MSQAIYTISIQHGVLMMLLHCIALIGCSTRPPSSELAVDDRRLVAVQNGRFELAVSVDTGRIVRYGPVGGQNVIWNNSRARECPTPFDGWINWGGDKLWIWPESDWKAWTGAANPHPPGDPSVATHDVTVVGRTIRMTSPVIAGYGVRMVREVQLDEGSSRVIVVNQLQQVSPHTLPLPVAPWVVTQVPAPRLIYANLVEGAQPPGHNSFGQNAWPEVRREGNVLVLPRPETPWAKIGIDADRLAAPVGDWLFVVSATGSTNGQPYESFRRAQVFSHADNDQFRRLGVGSYVELEFTGRPQVLRPGESATVTIQWELIPLAGRRPQEIIAASGYP